LSPRQSPQGIVERYGVAKDKAQDYSFLKNSIKGPHGKNEVGRICTRKTMNKGWKIAKMMLLNQKAKNVTTLGRGKGNQGTLAGGKLSGRARYQMAGTACKEEGGFSCSATQEAIKVDCRSTTKRYRTQKQSNSEESTRKEHNKREG